MQAYSISYTVHGKPYQALVDAKSVQIAKRKLGRKHGYKDGRMIKITGTYVIGYY